MVNNPAKYTDGFTAIFAEMLKGRKRTLDPFAGTCKIAEIKNYGYSGEVYCNELELEWGIQGVGRCIVTVGDSEHLPYPDNFFDAIATSPTYANRMADHHEAKDKSKRNTYRHVLGRPLTQGNTGMMQWGEAYREKHIRIWTECKRVLDNENEEPELILNMSDHIRKGIVIPVTDWHIECLQNIGFDLQEHMKIETPRLKYGANSNLRVPYESILRFILPKNTEG